MSDRLAFPMYAINRAETLALWRAVQHLLIAHGVPADDLKPSVPEGDLLSHWRHPDLLLSQTCGFPLVTQLAEVQTVGCFHYTAPGCEGINYRSFLVARAQDNTQTLADFRGKRVVCNAEESQSGYNVLLKRVAPLSREGRFFSQVVLSGSHRQSVIDLARGAADIAAIDCVTWALLQRHEPTLLDGLTVIEHTPLTPGLPLITAGRTSAQTLTAIRAALDALVNAPEYRSLCEAAFIGGFSAVSREPYSLLLDWRKEAAEAGVTRL
ncbi:phosphate/phosphite/phosphonate ABC transporter substrate-binding protein [Lelliottia sp. CFBP8978]|uniref:phosphate/phosphite/phosphonate ABC transporter substrate-binding protein n=1 Tax=Lelliottia sp. CFBP8978 TaxID=3096522 RepID=UPI002A6B28E8|nr:PhnD/SsuA/transferrin family substrate-binding protein [Lelliottia sp. CFBP8978]MDY1038279.1 PhnD/SsuA/transferrin family substrate-binding protein [Lelliottia sp. CFBP8978]